MVIRKLLETGVKLSKYDKQAWDALYFGIRTDIKKGIQTGGGLGTIIGNFLNMNDDDELDGVSKTVQYVPQTGTQDKARSGRGGRSYSRNRKYCRPNKYSRRSRSRYN